MNISELNVICLKWRGLIFKWSKMHDWATSFCTSTYVLTWVSACFCIIISLQCFPVNVEHCVTNTVPPSSWDIFAVSFVKQLAGGTSPRRAFGWALTIQGGSWSTQRAGAGHSWHAWDPGERRNPAGKEPAGQAFDWHFDFLPHILVLISTDCVGVNWKIKHILIYFFHDGIHDVVLFLVS